MARGRDRARAIVEGLGDGFLSFDAEWRVTDCNAVAVEMLGRGREKLLGRRFWDVSTIKRDSTFGALGRRVLAARTVETAEVVTLLGGKRRVLSVRVFPLADGVGAIWRDITELRKAERRLAESHARYRELADGTPAATWMTDGHGKLLFINPAMAEALGRPREALLGEGWIASIDPADRGSLLEARRHARETQGPFHYEGRFRHSNGELRIIELEGRPRFSQTGRFLGHVGMATDVTERRAVEKQQALLINELNHRVKNTLATVQSLIRLTFREVDDPKEAERLLTERILAISAAHDVLNREKWERADLEAIARAAIAPFTDGARIEVGGPKTEIAPQIAMALTIALSELATNALRHGALSTSAGAVRLSWTLLNGFVELEWRESGGPTVQTQRQAGFGTKLLAKSLPHEMGGAAELRYDPGGVVYRVSIPTIGAPTASRG